ncbi:hypothetical protein INQ51_10060 [Maribellus sp. CM-23]|uniref:hypothetical protein n=1 Tax=Maribellus sp. CM-23 TaxID=2781026 RepID=UPI001F1C0AE4|nr:hypothetical protein [Maribellus sp. CM-23]MCE4564654.1 hypothetical protein [Maribellus sp. CM-23]
MHRFLILLFLIVTMACSQQKQLQRSYIGKSIAALTEELGKPQQIFDNESGKVYIFEKQEDLKGTEINQGKLTLDPIVTPKVQKTERLYVTVKDGVIVNIKQENEYERQ